MPPDGCANRVRKVSALATIGCSAGIPFFKSPVATMAVIAGPVCELNEPSSAWRVPRKAIDFSNISIRESVWLAEISTFASEDWDSGFSVWADAVAARHMLAVAIPINKILFVMVFSLIECVKSEMESVYTLLWKQLWCQWRTKYLLRCFDRLNSNQSRQTNVVIGVVNSRCKIVQWHAIEEVINSRFFDPSHGLLTDLKNQSLHLFIFSTTVLTNRRSSRQPSCQLFNYCQHVRFVQNQILLVIKNDFGPAIAGKQDPVPIGDLKRRPRAVVV